LTSCSIYLDFIVETESFIYCCFFGSFFFCSIFAGTLLRYSLSLNSLLTVFKLQQIHFGEIDIGGHSKVNDLLGVIHFWRSHHFISSPHIYTAIIEFFQFDCLIEIILSQNINFQLSTFQLHIFHNYTFFITIKPRGSFLLKI